MTSVTAGYANPYATTCGGENLFDSNIFGFFPHISPGYNPKMGDGGYRDKPSGKTTQFYSLRAGYNDQIACSTVSFYTGCGDTALFDSYTNVKAQLNVGRGSTVIDSSTCVATMTGLPARRERRVISFWALGTRSSGISSPRSPRATITESHACRISSR